MAEDLFTLNPEDPWPGLYPYGEEHATYFHGREPETDELTRRVRGKSLTVLFGQSGLGKSSLIRAGLLPRLRDDSFEPHIIRFVFDVKAANFRSQLRAQLGAAPAVSISASLTSVAGAGADSADQQVVPVLIFDQFEELFTRGSETAEGREEVAAFLRELVELVENRPAPGQATQSASSSFRVLIALREDYLAQLESWRGEMPSIVENRMRLTALDGQGALRAVTRPAALRGEPPLISPAVARQVVRFLAGKDVPQTAEGLSVAAWEDFARFEIDPALLSLVLHQLNEERCARRLDQITPELLRETGHVAGILQTFYQRAMAGETRAVQVLVEEELLTDVGFRDNISVARAGRFLIENGVGADAIERLVERRVLRVEERLEQRRLELAHDVLSRIVVQSRDTRRREETRQEAERAARAAAQRAEEDARFAAERLMEAEAERESEARARAESERLRTNAEAATHRARRFAVAAGFVALLALAALAAAAWAWHEAERRRREARVAERVTDRALAKVQVSEEAALAAAGRAEEQAYFSHMMAAAQDYNDGRAANAMKMLLRHRHEMSGRDLRGWEWFAILGRLNDDVLRVHAHEGGINALAVSPDGTRVATGGADSQIAIWDLRSLQQPLRRIGAGSAPVLSLAWDASGRWIASGDGEGRLAIWDAKSYARVATHAFESKAAIRALAWEKKNSGTHLAVGGSMPELTIWSIVGESGTLTLEETYSVDAGVAALDWPAVGNFLAAGLLTAGRPIALINTNTKSVKFVPITAGSDVFGVALDPEGGEYLGVAYKHLRVELLGIPSLRTYFKSVVHRDYLSAIVWDPSGNYLATASRDGTVRCFSPFRREPVVTVLCGHLSAVTSLAWIGSKTLKELGGTLISGGDDGMLRTWKPQWVGSQRFEFELPNPRELNWIKAASWSPDGRSFAFVNFGNFAYVFDIVSGTLTGTFPKERPVPDDHTRLLFDVAWSPDGSRIATASRSENYVEVIDANSGKSLAMFSLSSADRVAWSRSGRLLAGAGLNELRVWNVSTGDEILALTDKPTGSVAWHSDEKRLAVGGKDGSIEIWDVSSKQRSAVWRQPQSAVVGVVPTENEPSRQVHSLAWNHDSSQLAFVTQDTVAEILDAGNGIAIHRLSGHTGGIFGVDWSPDGRRLATCGQDGTLRLYDSSSGEAVAVFMHGDGKDEVKDVEWSRDGERILTVGFDRIARVWDASRGYQLESAAVAGLTDAGLSRGELTDLGGLAELAVALGWPQAASEVYRRLEVTQPNNPSLETKRAAAGIRFGRALADPSQLRMSSK